jgi:hypothetical protein
MLELFWDIYWIRACLIELEKIFMNSITHSIVRVFCQLIYCFRACEDVVSEMLSGKVHIQVFLLNHYC